MELVDERLGHLRAGIGEFLDGQKLPALAGVHEIPGRRFTKTGHSHERRAQLPGLDLELRRVGMIDIDRREGKAAQIEFIADLKRGEQIVVLGAGILVLLDLLQLFLDKLDVRTAGGNVKLVNLSSNIASLLTSLLSGKVFLVIILCHLMYHIACGVAIGNNDAAFLIEILPLHAI